MLNRSNLYLAILLLLQTVLLAVAVITSTSTERRPTEPILTAFSVEAVERITIADDREAQVTLARGEAGWVLPDADDFPVNSAKVEELLGKIAGLNTARLVASNPASFARLEVKDTDFRRRLDILTDSSTEVLYLGGSGGVDTVYARRDGDDHVYLGIGLSSWEASAEISTYFSKRTRGGERVRGAMSPRPSSSGSFTFIMQRVNHHPRYQEELCHRSP